MFTENERTVTHIFCVWEVILRKGQKWGESSSSFMRENTEIETLYFSTKHVTVKK